MSLISTLLAPEALRRWRDAGLLEPDPRRLVAAGAVLPWFVGRGASLGTASQLWATAKPGARALVDRSGALTWQELDGRVNRLAAALTGLGGQPGRRVATLLRNGREQVETLLACQKAGLVAAPLNTFSKAEELSKVLTRADPAVLVVDARHLDEALAAELPRGLRVVVVGGAAGAPDAPAYEELLAAHDDRPPPAFGGPRGTPRIVIHTSGTTGIPKAAARRTGLDEVESIIGLLRVVPARTSDVVLVPAPQFHSFGLLATSLTLILGGTLVLPDRFDPAETLALVERHRASALCLVPVMIRRILALDEQEREAHDLSSLRILLASGSAIPPELRRRAAATFGPVLHDLYGSTEAGWVTVATPADMRARPEAVGRMVPGVEVGVFDADGERLAAGETGEVCVRGSGRFEGYEHGESARERDGWLGTGDLGSIDADGYLVIAGRADDMVVVGGENVYPQEVEDVIDALDGVVEVAVVGADDEEMGQVLVAFVVGDADEDVLRGACRDALPSYKVPRRFVTTDELPRTATGKVLARELVDRL